MQGWPKLRRRYWLALKTKQASSRDAIANIRNQQFDLFHITYRARALRGIRKVAPLFPYYLIVRVDEREQDWKVLCSTKGVTEVLGKVRDDAIKYFRSVCEKTDDGVYRYEDPAHEPPRFTHGDQVAGLRGLFQDKYGEYRGLAGGSTARVRVLFSILGREAEFEVNAVDLVATAA